MAEQNDRVPDRRDLYIAAALAGLCAQPRVVATDPSGWSMHAADLAARAIDLGETTAAIARAKKP